VLLTVLSYPPHRLASSPNITTLPNRPDVALLEALLPSVAARLHQADGGSNISRDGATAARLAARLLPALWRLAPAMESDGDDGHDPHHHLAALITQAEETVLRSSSHAASPKARVQVLAALARELPPQDYDNEEEEEGEAPSFAFVRRLATATLQGLLPPDNGMAALDGEGISTLLGALSRIGVGPSNDGGAAAAAAAATAATTAATALEERCLDLLLDSAQPMPLPSLARLATALARSVSVCSFPFSASSSPALLAAVGAALQGHLEALPAANAAAAGPLSSCSSWSHIVEAMNALSALRGGDSASGKERKAV
jgi:hypothetical protein